MLGDDEVATVQEASEVVAVAVEEEGDLRLRERVIAMMTMMSIAHKSGQSVKSFRLEVASVWHSNINSLSSSIKSFRSCGIIKLGTWVRSDRCCCNEYSCVHHYQYCGTPL